MENLVFYNNDDHSKEITTLAYGTVAQSSSDDTTLFVFNDSDSYQANDVIVTLDGGNAGHLWLSLDGTTFGTAVDIGDIPPNAGSAPFVLRRISVEPGSRSATLIATPTAWSSPVDLSSSANIGLDVANPPDIDFDPISDFLPPIPPA